MNINKLEEVAEKIHDCTQQDTDRLLKEVKEHQYPIIEVKEKVIRRIIDNRIRNCNNGVLFEKNDFDFPEIVGKEFAIKFTKFGRTIEYIHVLMDEKDGEPIISQLDVVSGHPIDDAFGKSKSVNDSMEYLISVRPTVNRSDYNSGGMTVNSSSLTILEQLGIPITGILWNYYHDKGVLWVGKTVFALSYISGKFRNHESQCANAISNRNNTSIHRTTNNSGSSPRVIEIGDISVIYPTNSTGARVFTRHTESWLVRGHLRHRYRTRFIRWFKEV